MLRLFAATLIATFTLGAAALAVDGPPAEPVPGLAAGSGRDAPRLTGPSPMPTVIPAPPIPQDVVDDRRKMRNYPEQPPVIPHSIRGYQIDLKTNKCMTCHGRVFTEQSQAPMVSVTHYQDREGNMLAQLSERRYFCTQCHVPQTAANPLVENEFVDMERLVGRTPREVRR